MAEPGIDRPRGGVVRRSRWTDPVGEVPGMRPEFGELPAWSVCRAQTTALILGGAVQNWPRNLRLASP